MKYIFPILALALTISLTSGTISYLGPYKISFDIPGSNSTLVVVGPLNAWDSVTGKDYVQYVGLINIPDTIITYLDINITVLRQYPSALVLNRSLFQAEVNNCFENASPMDIDETYWRKIDGRPAIVKIRTNTSSNTTEMAAISCIDAKDDKGKTFIILGVEPDGVNPSMNETEFEWLMDSFHILSGRTCHSEARFLA